MLGQHSWHLPGTSLYVVKTDADPLGSQGILARINSPRLITSTFVAAKNSARAILQLTTTSLHTGSCLQRLAFYFGLAFSWPPAESTPGPVSVVLGWTARTRHPRFWGMLAAQWPRTC